jgi:hypothetical protein
MSSPKKPKVHAYITFMRWQEGADKFEMQTQLYAVGGVYMCLSKNGRMIQQGGLEPPALARQQKRHVARLKAAGVEPYLGREKRVRQHETRGWYEVTQAMEDAEYEASVCARLIVLYGKLAALKGTTEREREILAKLQAATEDLRAHALREAQLDA